MADLKRRKLAGLATAMAGSVMAGTNAQGAPILTDPILMKAHQEIEWVNPMGNAA